MDRSSLSHCARLILTAAYFDLSYARKILNLYHDWGKGVKCEEGEVRGFQKGITLKKVSLIDGSGDG